MTEFVTVNIPQGTLRGKRVTSSSNGVTYYSFQGIPYAKPPVGPLRFKPPEDPEPWMGTRDATVEGSVAPQISYLSGKFIGDEDCLFLNVYTQNLLTTSPKSVMVWIHGGGYIVGSGNADVYGPDYLLAEDVVVVTINYRLGPLGFLYLEGADVTGNNGLRDQVMALKWVKKNIAQFGGDPGNVTIFGESAGSISVHYLMLSPLASGLFHRAIAQSAAVTALGTGIPRAFSSQIALAFAKMLGCTSEDAQDVASFLRTFSSQELMERLDNVKHRPSRMHFFPTEEAGPDAFLPASPIKLLQEGMSAKVPFMTGVTSAEGKLMLMPAFSETKLSALDQNFEATLPSFISQSISGEKITEVAKTIKKYYFGDKALNDDTNVQYIDMMSDLMFVYPTYKWVQLQTKWNPQPTYFYLFDHRSTKSIDVFPMAKNDHPGAAHGAELPYLFRVSLPHTTPPEAQELEFVARLVKLWTQFAKTGNPSSDEENITWTPASKRNLSYLRMNGGFNMESDIFKERMEFLDDLCLKFGISGLSD